MAFDKIPASALHATSSSQSLARTTMENQRKTLLASERTKILLESYRTGGANCPETFVTAVAAVLSRFPDQVIYEVTDPRIGLAVQLTWIPSLKEVQDACEKAYAPIRSQIEREKRIAEQLAMREREQHGDKPTYEQLQAKYGKDWGLDPTGGAAASRKPEPAPSWTEVIAMYQSQPGRILELANLLPKMRGEL